MLPILPTPLALLLLIFPPSILPVDTLMLAAVIDPATLINPADLIFPPVTLPAEILDQQD